MMADRARPDFGPLVDPAGLPEWMGRLVLASAAVDPVPFRRFAGSAEHARRAAVLMLFGDDGGNDNSADDNSAVDGSGGGPDVLLLRRADGLGAHAGQVAFPGGAAEPTDAGPVATALREATEEVGLDPDGVLPAAVWPQVSVPVSGFLVTPVLAYWARPVEVRPVDADETAAVARIGLDYLADPANRCQVRVRSEYVSPAFLAPGMLVWGFTAWLLTTLLSLSGWERPWDTGDVRELAVALADADELASRSGEAR